MMGISLGRWGPRHLLAAWSGYWAGLAAVTLTPIVIAIVRATSGPAPAGTRNVGASLGDAGITITIARAGHTILERSAGLVTIALWIGVPPLILWALWLRARSRMLAEGGTIAVDPTTPRGALPEPDPIAAAARTGDVTESERRDSLTQS